MSSLFGKAIQISSFGESHGTSIGVVLDGFPSNFELDLLTIQKELNRRRPGQSSISSPRVEKDEFQILSGIFEGKTTGAPICIVIPNTNHESKDYDALKQIYRPGHADKVYIQKYNIRDHKGGGRSSARVTASWVAAGAIAKQYLEKKLQIQIQSVVSSVHNIEVENPFELDWSKAEDNDIRCPDPQKALEMLDLIKTTQAQGDSLGGVISTKVINCPSGLGEPVFDKLNADISKAIFSINAVKGIEFGSGFKGTQLKGSEYNDGPLSNTNHEGGINAGISTGKDILFKTAFKPTSSISLEQAMENQSAEIIKMQIKGRHDPCVLPRAVPIIEAMTALVIVDHFLLNLKYDRNMTEIKPKL